MRVSEKIGFKSRGKAGKGSATAQISVHNAYCLGISCTEKVMPRRIAQTDRQTEAESMEELEIRWQ